MASMTAPILGNCAIGICRILDMKFNPQQVIRVYVWLHWVRPVYIQYLQQVMTCWCEKESHSPTEEICQHIVRNNPSEAHLSLLCNVHASLWLRRVLGWKFLLPHQNSYGCLLLLACETRQLTFRYGCFNFLALLELPLSSLWQFDIPITFETLEQAHGYLSVNSLLCAGAHAHWPSLSKDSTALTQSSAVFNIFQCMLKWYYV